MKKWILNTLIDIAVAIVMRELSKRVSAWYRERAKF